MNINYNFDKNFYLINFKLSEKNSIFNLNFINNKLNICNSTYIYYYSNCNKNINLSIDYKYNFFKNIENININKINDYKINNNKINILFCSDQKYFIGLFSSLTSVIKNTSTDNLYKLHFNFFIPLKDNNIFKKYLKKLNNILNISLNYTIILVDLSIISNNILESKCFNGGNHLLNVGNFSRLLIGEIFSYEKLLYLDSDSIIKNDLYQKICNINLDYPVYLQKGDRDKLTLYLKSILQPNIKWINIINKDISLNNYAYFGAPMLVNCKKWNNVFDKIKNIISIHNKHKNGIYKLFTMSLLNIVFYDNIGNLNNIINCLPDCGSLRKNWTQEKLDSSDVLDWSGNLKPWFVNGLYKHEWEKYNILSIKINKENKNNKNNKNTIEKFS